MVRVEPPRYLGRDVNSRRMPHNGTLESIENHHVACVCRHLIQGRSYRHVEYPLRLYLSLLYLGLAILNEST